MKPSFTSRANDFAFEGNKLFKWILILGFGLPASLIVLALASGLLYNPWVIGNNAKGEANKYIASLSQLDANTKYSLVSVSNQDSDSDGYVTATIFELDTKTGRKQTQLISCNYKFFASGCSPWKPKNAVVTPPSQY
jgi:hypothetical protein